MFKYFKQRGQVLVLYALLIPLLFLFAGVGFDLGWYYLNVSRLQNAADAAVLAGAYKLIEQEKFNYIVKVLRTPPNDLTEYDKVRFNTIVEQLNMADGEEVAKLYSGKNLGHVVEGESMMIFDDWNTSADTAQHEVTLTAALYAKLADAQWDENGIKYYGVTLEEKVTHLFLRGFEPMDAIVTSYVMLRPHDVDLITVIKELEDTKVIANWQYQKEFHDAQVNWNHYRQTGTNNSGSSGQKTISYVAGEYFRTETVNVEVQMGDGKNNGFNGTNNHSSGQKTSASKRNGQQVYYGEYDQYGGVDSLNIDFNQDIQTQFLTDWDLGAATDKKVSYVTNAMDGWDATHGYDLRIQGLINFRDAWKNRNLMDEDTSNDLIPDPLWVRIESDPWWSGTKAPYANGVGWDSVHQMIISIDKSNAVSEEDIENESEIGYTTKAYNSASGNFDGYDIEGGKAYKYRPFFIFYKGPEVYDENNTVRKSQPVILNLNADWNGILYAPNSPVVILGNQKKLTGFVIAKEFVQLAEVSDYTNQGYKEYTDENGKPILVKSVTASELDNEYPTADYKKTIDTEGNISFSKYKKLPKHFIVEAQYVKGISGYNDNNYVAALKKYREIYDADLKKYRAVTDNDIVQIQFPTYDAFNAENNHQIYHVVEADLMDEDLNKQYSNAKDTFLKAEYVPVVRVDTGETKYIAKENVPYVRLFREQGGKACYPYIPVCDLKKPPAVSGYGSNGVTLADDTHNVYDGKKKIVAGMEDYIVDKEGLDKWRCVSTTMTKAHKYYDSNADPYQITKTDDSGMKYFISLGEKTEVDTYNENPDVTVTYKKVGNDAYFNENETYYTYYDYPTNSKDPIEGSDQNVIHLVMDNKGNVQTKALDEGSSEPITKDYKFQPGDKRFDTTTDDLETGERTKDYRLSEYEVRYKKKEAFNLSEKSRYSYFQIPSLHRVNYEYMNVDELNQTSETDSGWDVEDMFFTTRRANWID